MDLSQLLEDDVRNLQRMTSGASASASETATGLDIPEHELSMLLDRERLFAVIDPTADFTLR